MAHQARSGLPVRSKSRLLAPRHRDIEASSSLSTLQPSPQASSDYKWKGHSQHPTTPHPESATPMQEPPALRSRNMYSASPAAVSTARSGAKSLASTSSTSLQQNHERLRIVMPGTSTPSVEGEKPRRNVLRRKNTTLSQQKTSLGTGERSRARPIPNDPRRDQPQGGVASLPERSTEPLSESVFGIAPPPVPRSARPTSSHKHSGQQDVTRPSWEDPRDTPPETTYYRSPSRDQDVPIPFVPPHTASPSTRYSESPGPWSRTSTPTTMSSYSPSMGLPPRMGAKPPTPRTHAVEEHSYGSSPKIGHGAKGGTSRPLPEPVKTDTKSKKMVSPRLEQAKDTAAADGRSAKKDRKKTRRPPSPPNPPPRKSSVKFKKATKAEDAQPSVPQNEKFHEVQVSKIPRAPSPMQRSGSVSSQKPSPSAPPRRPSRDGAPDLNTSLLSETPIIHSNLTSPPGISHNRRSSTDSRTSISQEAQQKSVPRYVNTGTSRYDQGSQVSSRNPSPLPRQHERNPFPAPSQVPRPAETRVGRSRDEGPTCRGASPMRGVSSRSTSRLRLFSRREKPDGGNPTAEKPAKLTRKGPAAGTGHEGYGRYAVRGRSGSTTSTTGSWARSTSNSSGSRSEYTRRDSFTSKGTHELDDFFLDRLDPVVIKGGSRNGDAGLPADGLLRVDSSQSSFANRPSIDSGDSGSTQFSISSRGHIEGVFTGAGSTGPTAAPAGFESNDEEPPLEIFHPAQKQSRHMLRHFGKKTTLRIPQHGVDYSPSAPPALPSSSHRPLIAHAEQTALHPSASSVIGDVSEGKEGNWLKPKSAEKKLKPAKRWNFFQRAHATASKSPNPEQSKASAPPEAELTSQAHYTLLDRSEELSSENLGDLVLEIEKQRDGEDTSDLRSDPRKRLNGNSMLLPDRPYYPPDPSNKRSASPRVILGSTETLASASSSSNSSSAARSNRLAAVGRIPRVISTRELRSSPQSFSRPFTHGKSSNASSTSNLAEEVNSAPRRQSRSSGNFSRGSAREENSEAGVKTTGIRPPLSNHHSKFSFANEEFLRISPRKNSEQSYSSSSGNASIIPPKEAAIAHDPIQKEDDIWREYDDFIDDVLSPGPGPSTSGSSLCQKEQSTFSPCSTHAGKQKSPRKARHGSKKSKPPLPLTPPPDLPPLGGLPQLVAEVQPSPTFIPEISQNPSMSFSDVYAGYHEDGSTADESAGAMIHDTGSQNQKGGPELEQSPSTGDAIARHQASSSGSDTAADRICVGLDTSMNVRFAGLMTSKWLSFGQVLFSPAHLEMKEAGRPRGQNRLLVLDGLGNDDWSYYCALTYTNATVYNLSPSRSSTRGSGRSEDSSTWRTPANHRQIHHPHIANPFPFPRGFFCAVVFRFPAACSDDAFRTAVSECKRVLRPGGFLEVSVMDLDMMNMGNRARRALRMLKVRMQVADETVSLKSASDNVQRLLGRRGFENLNRCTLGVPAAGTLVDSRASSMDESGLSLGELLRDQTQQGDVGITKMVAKVGRWWYSRCYETMILPDADTSDSIWNDRALLRECEKWKTSFKLLICYAQKPATPKRRTVSV